MGNYSKVYGEIWLKPKSLDVFKKKYNKSLSNYPDFDKMFIIEDIDYEESMGAKLHFNPLYHSFKLLGYPDYLDEFLSFFRDGDKFIDGFKIMADVEDDSCFIFDGWFEAENPFRLKLFRVNEGITDNETYVKWHSLFLETLKEKANKKGTKDR